MSDYDLVPNDGAGGLQPYTPDAPLSPSNDSWLVPTPDFVGGDHYSGTPQLFGADLPAGTTMDQARAVVKQITDAFSSDMAHLKFDSWMVKEAVQWFKSEALLPPGYVEPTHRYNLRGYRIPEADQPAVNSFLNAMYRANVPQRFCQACLWWLTEFGKRNTQQQQQQGQISATIDQLSDAEFAIVEKRAESDRQRAELALRSKWRWQYEANLELVKSYIGGLPRAERDYLLNAVAAGGEMLVNNASVIERFYQQAVSAARVPNTSAGASVAEQIAAIEGLMKRDRKAYNADLAIQNKLRDLYRIRDGG